MTHMQHAQPILLSHYLAGARGSFPARRHPSATRRRKCRCVPDGFWRARRKFLRHRPQCHRARTWLLAHHANSLDAVSDRDFALDYLFALTGIATHLSRLAEDFVIFASQEFSYVDSSRRILHRQQPYAAKEKSRLLGTDSRQIRAHHWRARQSAHDAQRACPPATSATFRKTRKPSSLRTIKSLTC